MPDRCQAQSSLHHLNLSPDTNYLSMERFLNPCLQLRYLPRAFLLANFCSSYILADVSSIYFKRVLQLWTKLDLLSHRGCGRLYLSTYLKAWTSLLINFLHCKPERSSREGLWLPNSLLFPKVITKLGIWAKFGDLQYKWVILTGMSILWLSWATLSYLNSIVLACI